MLSRNIKRWLSIKFFWIFKNQFKQTCKFTKKLRVNDFFLCWTGPSSKKMKKNMTVKLKKKLKIEKKAIKPISFDSSCVRAKMRNTFLFFVKNIDKFLSIVLYLDSIFSLSLHHDYVPTTHEINEQTIWFYTYICIDLFPKVSLSRLVQMVSGFIVCLRPIISYTVYRV